MKIYRLVLDDYGSISILGLFETEAKAHDVLAIILSMKPEAMVHDPNVKMRCFEFNGKRYIDQSGKYFVEEVTPISQSDTLTIKPMTVKDYMAAEDAENHKPMAEKEADLSDLC